MTPGAAQGGAIHRLGGGHVENLRLKPAEAALDVPGISVLAAASASEAVEQVRHAFPAATRLIEAATIVGTTTPELIRGAGFEIVHAPTRKLPNHCRIVHPAGVTGFSDEDLKRLAAVFTNSTVTCED